MIQDILHCHDWSSAPVAWLFKEHYIHYGLSNSRVVFTIHNLEFGIQNIGRAMKFADKATTVSPTYSREISGNPAISPHLFKFHGIVNGIDPDIWDPYNDHFIPVTPLTLSKCLLHNFSAFIFLYVQFLSNFGCNTLTENMIKVMYIQM